MTQRPAGPRPTLVRLFLALAVASVFMTSGGAAPARADGTPDLMGDWTVDPFRWKVSGCLYEQWVVIQKRTGPTTYTGVSRQRHNCLGRQGGISETHIVITLKGKKVLFRRERFTPE